MLKNLNENLCVSRFSNKEADKWICYEPSTTCSDSKRRTWKRLTGLLSQQEMCRYLEKNHPCSEITDTYQSISSRP